MTPAAGIAMKFIMKIGTPSLRNIPPYLGPADRVNTPESFIAAFLRPDDPLANETFEFARRHQSTHYVFLGFIHPANGEEDLTTIFDWPDSLRLVACTKNGSRVKADYILGHTQCLTGETPVKGYYYWGGRIFWIYPRPDRTQGQSGVPGPYTNFLVQSPANPRCRILVLLPRAGFNEKSITGWRLEMHSSTSPGPEVRKGGDN